MIFKKFLPEYNFRILSLFFFLMLSLFIAYFALSSNGVLQQKQGVEHNQSYERVVANIADQEFALALADTRKKRTKGLSGVPYLNKDEGMLFIFDDGGKHGFWMKDMLFSIDILWLDEDFRIVDFKTNLRPDSYPDVFYPSTSSVYAIEIKAGLFDELGLSIGDQIVFP